MKTPVIVRIEQNPVTTGETRLAGPRIHTSKPIEHRHERRKIREQLRRLDWVHGREDEMFA